MMNKQQLMKTLAVSAVLGCSANAMAQSETADNERFDVTASVLRNADFSTDFTTDSENRWTLATPGSYAHQSGKWKEAEAIDGYMESWINPNTALNNLYIAQTTPQLPKGTYTITLNYNGAVKNVNGGTPMTNIVAFANETTTPLTETYVAPNAGTCSFTYTNTADRPVTIGIKATDATNANWIAVDNFKVEYHGTEAEFATAQYGMVALRDYSSYIANASCAIHEHSAHHSWLRSGSASGYVEAPASITTDGTAGVSYWSNGAETGKSLIYQTVSGLPAGKYRLTAKAAATAFNNGAGNDNREGGYLFANDEQTAVTTAQYGDYTLDFSVAADGDEVTLGLKAGSANGNNWCFLSSVSLTRFSEVTLNETDTEAPEADNMVAKVTVNRTLKKDTWNTLCLPFSMDVPEGWQVKELTGEGQTTGELVFSEATAIKAGKPYIVKTAADITTFSAENVTITPATSTVETANFAMTGNYTRQFVPQGSYFISNNTFYLADQPSAVTLKGFRAYISAKDETSQARPQMLVIDGIATGINAVEGMSQAADNGYRSLTGISVKQPKMGLYIHNNKKVIIK